MEVSETHYVSIQRESNYNVCDLVKKMVGSFFPTFPESETSKHLRTDLFSCLKLCQTAI